jgi:hypothetical protein
MEEVTDSPVMVTLVTVTRVTVTMVTLTITAARNESGIISENRA